MRTSLVFAAALAVAVLVAPASAEYPEKPVTFVVPFPPGDLEDVLTRMIAEDFQEAYGVPAAVVNKPGGGGGPFPGAAEVAAAPADGTMIGSFVVGVPVVGPQLGIPALSPDPFEPLGVFLTYPFVIATLKDAPYDTMEALAEHSRSNGLVLGHFGNFLIPTQVTLALAKKMEFEWAADAAFDALDCNTLNSGDVDVMNTTLQQVLPCLDDIQVLATVTGERIAKVDYAPTVGELDAELDMALWNGLFVHKDTPADIREKIIAVASETVKSDRAQKLSADTGAQVYWLDAAASAERIKKDIDTTNYINSLLE